MLYSTSLAFEETIQMIPFYKVVFLLKIQLERRYIFYCLIMNEVSESCSLCNKPNDQMLMLSCVHDPCINCAASAYAEQIHLKHQNKDVYICEICGEQTLLDNSTVLQLSALANSVIKLPSRPQAKNQTISTAPKRKETQHPTSVPTGATPSKKIIYYCKEHSQQQISYYCFTCFTNICPECAIHGSHKDHEVKLIKKAISQVKAEYLDIVTRIGDFQGSMNKLKDGFLKIIKDTNERHSREKNAVTREFDILRATLSAKEKEIIRELEEVNKHNLAALTQFLEMINSNYEEANKTKRAIETITKKDEVLILEDYRKIGDLQQAVAALSKNNQSIAGHCSHLNVQFLQQQCKELSESVGRVKVNLKKEDVGWSSILSTPRAAHST